MKILLILAAVMSFVVQTKNSVQAEGDYPNSMQATYSNTYNKGQVRQGDVATLSLSHLGGITVTEITLSMSANNTSGAGDIVVKANGTQIGETSVNYTEVSEPVMAYCGVMADVDELTISIVGTQNSLYVNAFTIAYEPAATRKITLMHGSEEWNTLAETSGGAGVMLPTMVREGDWVFEGWTPVECWTVYERPETVYPSGRYYPKEDGTLWALYSYDAPRVEQYITTLASGEYMYVNSETHKAMTGVPADGRMEATTIQYAEDQIYQVDFLTETTAMITHSATGTPIGYNSSAKMDQKTSVWNVHHDGEETLFYAEIGGKNYLLMVEIYDEHLHGLCVGLLAAEIQASPMRLMSIMIDDVISAYTCHPEVGMGIDAVTNEETNERVLMHFGHVDLILKNGKKELRLR